MAATLKVVIIILLTSLVSFANGDTCKPERLKKSSGTPTKSIFNINNISTYIYNNGDADLNPTGDSGFEFPKGSGIGAVFESGVVWGAKINGEIRVGGSTYNQGLVGGAIKEDGTPEDKDAEHVRIYRVCTDLTNYDFSDDELKLNLTEAEIKEQYEKDWNEWPAEYGAPFEDVDNDGIYNPLTDIPGVPGAHQTLWYVANDFDPYVTKGVYGSDPFYLELQVTVWGYNEYGPLGNTVFKKFKVTNKSESEYEDMYFSFWIDPDLGDAGDDEAGVDRNLNMGYVYNGLDKDRFYGANPPAVGYDFVQGPIVKGTASDEAIFDGKKLSGYKNLPLTGHYHFVCGGEPYIDPSLRNYAGTLHFYNIMNGLHSRNGMEIINPITGELTTFTLDGDPVTNIGWTGANDNYSCGDKSNVLTSGSFNMQPGETQELVIAQIGAFGNGRLDAVTKLRQADYKIQKIYDNLLQYEESPPLPPKVDSKFSDWNTLVKLEWDALAEVESFDENGYQFQGYNIYQQSGEYSAKLIATFDKIDGVTSISQPLYDASANSEILQQVRFGTDSGLKYELDINKDFITNSNLIKGKSYSFGVTAYTYTEDETKEIRSTESLISMFNFVYRESEEGFKFDDRLETEHAEGISGAEVSIKIADPDSLTGHDYEVFFNQKHYYLADNGEWTETKYPDEIGGNLSKDLAGSSLSGVAYPVSADEYDLVLTLDLVSSFYSYCDGIKLSFPSNVQIVKAYESDRKWGDDAEINNEINTVQFGSPDTSARGKYKGGETFTIKINKVNLPLSIDYEIWDDGWGAQNASNYGATDEVRHAVGTTTITEIEHYFKTENYWNVRDVTIDQVKVEKQKLKNTLYYNDHLFAAVDGLEISVTGSYDSPKDLDSYDVTRDSITTNYPENANAASPYSISSFYHYGWAPSGRSVDAFGTGETATEILQQDYELRFTGEYEDAPDANGIWHIKEGTGSIATIYNARGMDGLEVHPLNPNPGSDASFTMRIPFEIWNIDDSLQVNIVLVDRLQQADANPFYAFYASNPNGRMYAEILNTPYSEEVQDVENDASLASHLTWNLVFWLADWRTGDVVRLNYENPIQLGVDKFTFSTHQTFKKSSEIDKDVMLYQNYPNPFNPTTKFKFVLKDAGLVKIKIFDILGREVTTVLKEEFPSGIHIVDYNGSGLASGVYIYRIEAEDFMECKKMMILK